MTKKLTDAEMARAAELVANRDKLDLGYVAHQIARYAHQQTEALAEREELIQRMAHGALETAARAEATEQRASTLAARLAEVEAAKDGAYNERNQLVAALSRIYPSGLKQTDIPGWEPEWHGCVYIDTPAGQMSWHYHDRDAALFAGLPAYQGEWDGHSTDEKYARLAALAQPEDKRHGG